jgi:hypothetical protein
MIHFKINKLLFYLNQINVIGCYKTLVSSVSVLKNEFNPWDTKGMSEIKFIIAYI